MSDATLDDAISGLKDASEYARSINHYGIAAELGMFCELLKEAAPREGDEDE